MSEFIKLGDDHNGNATGMVKNGNEEYIFKPRDAATEKAWQTFLDRLGKMGFEYLPGFVSVLDEKDGTHTEKVVRHTSTDKDGIKRYYKRFGSLVFLTYILASTDLHAENIIANGEYPVIVDMENLLSSNITRTQDKRGINSTALGSQLTPKFYGDIDTSGGSGTVANGNNLPTVDGKAMPILRNL